MLYARGDESQTWREDIGRVHEPSVAFKKRLERPIDLTAFIENRVISAMKPAIGLLAVFSAGCMQPEKPIQSSNASTASPSVAVVQSAASTNLAVPMVTVEPQIEPMGTAGPAYVLVDHSGVLELTDQGTKEVFPVPKDRSSHWDEIKVSPSGTLWLSDFQGIRARALGGEILSIRSVKDGPMYEKIVLRSEKDAWAVSSDIEWSILHYDGSTWTPVRQRKQFSGRYDDNKFSGLVVTSEGVWVASWNGVWRGNGAQWEPIKLPEGAGIGPDLFVYRDQLVLVGAEAAFLRQAGAWKQLVWPERILLRWAVSDLGFVAAPLQGTPRVVIGPIDGPGKFVESDLLVGQDIRALTFDGMGRLWVGTDQALAVVDHRGHLLAQWAAGTLDGLTGSILDIAVVGTGPVALPKAKPARKWEVKGKFVTYKRRAPLAGATLLLCTSGASSCVSDPRAKRFTTDGLGQFHFADVPDGEFRLSVTPPAGTDDCNTPFTRTDNSLVPTRDCHEAAGSPGICDLGTITTCLPFEMPPPH